MGRNNHIKTVLDFGNQIKAIFTDSKLYTVKNSSGSIPDYQYFVYPFKGFNIYEPKYEVSIANCLARMLDGKIDLLITFESDGIGITKLVSSFTNIPMLICKPFHYNYECLKFVQLSGYNKRLLYLPRKLMEHKRIAIIDVIVSTGGTINSFLNALKNQGVDTEVSGIYSVVHKHNYNGYRINSKQFFGKYNYKFILELEIFPKDKGKLRTKVSLSKHLKEIKSNTEENNYANRS